MSKVSRDALRAPIATPDGGPINYPSNHWWVAALSQELPAGKLLARQILGKSVVLYRKQDGGVCALENRCIHRAAPLSLGDLVGDNISCRYHGFQFGPSGRCVHIPSQDLIPPAAAIRAYPVQEIGPLIWIWTGELGREGESKPSDFAWLHDPTWLQVREVMPLEANYMSLKENVLDLTHFGFVHAKSFQILDWDRPPEVSVKDGAVRYEKRFNNRPMSRIDARLSGLGDRRLNTTAWGQSLSPAIHEAGFDANLIEPAPGERSEYRWRILHITTPASPRSTHYWWIIGADYGQNVAGAEDWVRDGTVQGFLEDKVVLEAIQRAADEDPTYADVREISVEADKSGLQARRLLATLMSADRQDAEAG